jgi:lipopolysaccharide/colanic/teichoic acid biosynthesis glycosyltransferase
MLEDRAPQSLRSDLGGAARLHPGYVLLKRPLDILTTVIVAPLALVIVGILAVLVRMDGEKAFFCQLRVGRDGRLFKLWKLRTMVPDADLKLQAYLSSDPQASLEWMTAQKLKDDPRITRLGKYLRKYSLDELPQLLNVFLGEMSLVGPRPMMPEQRHQYPGTAYFRLRPGLTGLWQISERNACSFAERAHIDTRYSRIMSLGTDLWIIMQTPLVVLKGTGV